MKIIFLDIEGVLDDNSDMVHLMSHLLQTNGEFGLTNEIANEAIKQLNN